MLTVTAAAPSIFSRTLSASLDPWPCRRIWESRRIASAASSVTATKTTTEVEGASTAAPVKGTAATTSERVRAASQRRRRLAPSGLLAIFSVAAPPIPHDVPNTPTCQPALLSRPGGADRRVLVTRGSNPAARSVSRAVRRSGPIVVGPVDRSASGSSRTILAPLSPKKNSTRQLRQSLSGESHRPQVMAGGVMDASTLDFRVRSMTLRTAAGSVRARRLRAPGVPSDERSSSRFMASRWFTLCLPSHASGADGGTGPSRWPSGSRPEARRSRPPDSPTPGARRRGGCAHPVRR